MPENLNIRAKVGFIPSEDGTGESVQMSGDPQCAQTASELHVQAVLVSTKTVSPWDNWKGHCQVWALQRKGKTLR